MKPFSKFGETINFIALQKEVSLSIQNQPVQTPQCVRQLVASSFHGSTSTQHCVPNGISFITRPNDRKLVFHKQQGAKLVLLLDPTPCCWGVKMHAHTDIRGSTNTYHLIRRIFMFCSRDDCCDYCIRNKLL